MILATVNDSCFSIGGEPYAKGSLFPVFYPATGKVEFRRNIAPGATLIDPYHYSDYIDASTGNPFASYSAVVAWIEANLFMGIIGGTSGTTLPFMQWIYVVAVPAADDEVAPGHSFLHEFLDTGVLRVMQVGGTMYNPDDFTHTDGVGTGEVEFVEAATNFVAGDVVLLLKTLE